MQLKDFCELCPRFSLTWTACLKGNTELAPSSAQEKLGASVPRSIGTEPQQVFRSILLFKLTIVCQPKSLYPLSLGSPRPQGQGAVCTARGRSDSPALPDDTFPHQHFQEIGAITDMPGGWMSPYHSLVVLEDSDWLGNQPFPPCQNDSRQRLPHTSDVPAPNSCFPAPL